MADFEELFLSPKPLSIEEEYDLLAEELIERLETGESVHREEVADCLTFFVHKPLPDKLREYTVLLLRNEIKQPRGRKSLSRSERFSRDVQFWVRTNRNRQKIADARQLGQEPDGVARDGVVWVSGAYELSMRMTADFLLGDPEKWEQVRKRVNRFQRNFPKITEKYRFTGP